jgi:aspartate carbamoyltransferase catalytic subunit
MGRFAGKDILSTERLSRDEIEEILSEAKWMLGVIERRTSLNLLAGRILATLFFQTSTRTRLSFESAMQRLGGSVLGFASADSSRATGPRAETLEDTIRTVDQYADVIVLRHPDTGAATRAAGVAVAPVLNGGDGTNQHPSQGLLDTYTIWHEKGTLDGLTIGMVGDLRSTRGMHSLVHCLSNFHSRLILVSPEQLRFDDSVKRVLKSKKVEFEEATDVDRVIKELDVMYVTRLNKEGAGEGYEALLTSYPRITLALVNQGKKDLIVMHDLPRTDELGLQIEAEVDDSPYARYFQEMKYGVAVRMAMLALTQGVVG